MIQIRKSQERGKTHIDWLESYHTFSFGDYEDKRYVGFGPLRVINQDQVKPGCGFGTHPHKNMEIITYVIEGELEHRDSTGTGSVIRPGEIQRMSAGSGIAHSEFNHSKSNTLHFLQIWIYPNQANLPPSYEQKKISKQENQLVLIGAQHSDRNTSNNVLTIHQAVNLYTAILNSNTTLSHSIEKQRGVYIHLFKGKLEITGDTQGDGSKQFFQLAQGDGAFIVEENLIEIKAITDNAEFLLFDLKIS